MKFSKEQLLKLMEPTRFDFELTNIVGEQIDVFNEIKNIKCNVILNYYDDKCDVDLICKFDVELFDVNTHKKYWKQFEFETFLVVSDVYFEDEFMVYFFEKNTLNLDTIIKEEIYYRLPQDFTTEKKSLFMEEDEFYYQEYQKIIAKDKEKIVDPRLEKLKNILDN